VGRAGLAESLQLFAASTLARFLIVRLAPHLFAKSAPLAEFAKATDGFLDRLTGPNP
jgi:hypothetical protein